MITCEIIQKIQNLLITKNSAQVNLKENKVPNKEIHLTKSNFHIANTRIKIYPTNPKIATGIPRNNA